MAISSAVLIQFTAWPSVWARFVADQWHSALEYAEDQADAQLGAGVDSRHPMLTAAAKLDKPSERAAISRRARD